MRITLILLSLVFNCNTFACDKSLQNYPIECATQDKFNLLKNDFKTVGINPLNLKGYELQEALGNKFFYANKNELINGPKPILENNLQWKIWKKIPTAILKLNTSILELNDLNKLQNSLQSTYFSKLRTGNAQINPILEFNCEDEKITDAVVSLFDNYDLRTEEGYPLLVLQKTKNCTERKNIKSGSLVFYKNSSIKAELNRWLMDFNDALLRYESNKAMELSPYNYLADMRRWFLAISPFSEGNSSIIEALIFYATNRLHLPPIGFNQVDAPFLLTVEENRNRSLTKINQSLSFFEGCLFDVKTNLTSEDCQTL